MRKALLPLQTKGSRAFRFVWNVLVGNERSGKSDALDCVVAGAHVRRLAAALSSGRPPVSVRCGLLVLGACRSSLLGVLLGVLPGAQSLRLVLFLGFFLVDDLCEELLHLLGHAGG